MLRLIGALIGSVLAIAVLIIAVGVPVLTPTDVGPPTPVADEPQQAPVAAQAAERAAAAAAAAPPVPESVAATAAEPEQAAAPEPPTEALPEPDELRWHAFWSPFRSRIAANGFVAQLQRVTGLDYRVVNVRPGVYEVAFAYTEDDEVAAHLAQISAATGLDVPGS